MANTVAPADTKHAYQLLEQKQFAAAAKEAKELTASFPNDPEAWKIADGKLYWNYSKEVQSKWAADVPGNIQKAGKNWLVLHK